MPEPWSAQDEPYGYEDPRILAAEIDALDPDPTGELADVAADRYETQRWENLP